MHAQGPGFTVLDHCPHDVHLRLVANRSLGQGFVQSEYVVLP